MTMNIIIFLKNLNLIFLKNYENNSERCMCHCIVTSHIMYHIFMLKYA